MYTNLIRKDTIRDLVLERPAYDNLTRFLGGGMFPNSFIFHLCNAFNSSFYDVPEIARLRMDEPWYFKMDLVNGVRPCFIQSGGEVYYTALADQIAEAGDPANLLPCSTDLDLPECFHAV